MQPTHIVHVLGGVDSPDPDETLEELTHAEGKEEGHEEKGQEVQEEEIVSVDTINAYVAGCSRVSVTGAGREG
ncbi:MAG TPA: hypothetical protein VGJ08_01115 [Rhizomicrobium sp.]